MSTTSGRFAEARSRKSASFAVATRGIIVWSSRPSNRLQPPRPFAPQRSVFSDTSLHNNRYGMHGGVTIRELMSRHKDALEHIATHFNDRIGVFAEGLGGFVVFYVALTESPMKSVVFQNAPATLTEEKFRAAILQGKVAALRRKIILPFDKLLLRIVPHVKLPISSYLDWKELIDTKEENREVETRLVVEGYLNDPDFDTWYPLSAIMSLLLTPPPQPLTALQIPTMFLAALRGFGGDAYVKYVKDVYHRLPNVKKRFVEVDGSAYWMLSHPKEAAERICEWFDETLSL